MLGLGLGTNRSNRKGNIIDPDVQAFVEANSITNTQEIMALSSAVTSLKGSNSLSYNFWGDTVYANFISPTGLTQAKEAIKVFSGESTTASEIGASPAHSSDGVLFNGSSNAFNLGNTTGNINREDLAVVLAFSNNATVNGTSYGKVIDNGDSTPGNWERTQCYRQNNSGIMGFLYGTTTGISDRIGVWNFGNDGTNHAIWHDGVKLALTTTPIVNGIATGADDDFLGARNGDASGIAGAFRFQDDRVTTVLTFNMTTLYTDTHHEILAQIVNTYNTDVV